MVTVLVLKRRLVCRTCTTQVENPFKMVRGEVQRPLVAMADLGVMEEVRSPQGEGVDTQGEVYNFGLVQRATEGEEGRLHH